MFVPKSTARCVEVRLSETTGNWYGIMHQDFEVHVPGGRDLLGEVENYQPKLYPTGRVQLLTCTYSFKSDEAPDKDRINRLIGNDPKIRIVRELSAYADKGCQAKLYGQSHGDQAGLLILDQHNRPIYLRSYLSDGKKRDYVGEVDLRSDNPDECSPIPGELLGLYPASLKYVEELRKAKGQRSNTRIPAPIAAQLARA